MKKILTIILLLGLLTTVWSQSPEKMNYQAIIYNLNSELIIEQTIGMRISILEGSMSGLTVYVETQNPQTNSNGLISIEIGAGVIISGSFENIAWSGGSYFLKTEIDPGGGSNYTIIGVSPMLSVPYALHAKTASSIAGGITETDPVYSNSIASGISGADTALWNNNSSGYSESDPVFSASVAHAIGISDTMNWNNKLSNYTENDPVFSASASYGISAADTIRWNNDTDPANELQTFSVSTTGDTLRLSQGNYVIIPGISAANISPYPASTVHCNGSPTAIVEVLNPTTGKVWMDRNLGATQAATSGTDVASFGDLYQWGRAADGHQCRNSATTTTQSTTANPGHGSFIEGAPDWCNPQNDNLWQGVNGTNNPCPSGYRLPTEAEWEPERQSWSSNNAVGAIGSPLKLPVAGSRSFNGTPPGPGSFGIYWSSTVDGTNSRTLNFGSSNAAMDSSNRANGFSLRCLKN